MMLTNVHTCAVSISEEVVVVASDYDCRDFTVRLEKSMRRAMSMRNALW